MGQVFSNAMFITVSFLVVISISSFDAKNAQHGLVLSAGITRITFGQIQTNQDKPQCSKGCLNLPFGR